MDEASSAETAPALDRRTTRPPGRVRRLVRGFFYRSLVDRLIGLSAEIAFYEFFAIFPFLIFCVNCIALLPTDGLILMLLEKIAPGPTVELFSEWIEAIRASSGLTLLSISALMSLWVGSSGIGSFIDAFAYINRKVSRAGIVKRYVMRVFFTAVGAVGLMLLLFLWVIGPALVEWLFSLYGISGLWVWIWGFVRLPLAAAVVVLGLMIFYHFLSLSGRRFRDHWAGACLAAAVFWIASMLFSLYVRGFADFNATFGSLGAIIILLLWLQTLNFSVLVGEFWNAEIHHSARETDLVDDSSD